MGKKPPAATLADFLDGHRAPRKSARVTLRSDLLADHAQAQADYQVALRGDLAENRIPEAPAIRARIAALEDEIGASEFTFTFKALPRGAYIALVKDHPARAEDTAAGLPFNADTFTPALLAACAVEPVLSVADAEKVCDTLSAGQFDKVWTAVVAVNLGDDAAPKSVLRSAPVDPDGTPSTTADLEESP